MAKRVRNRFGLVSEVPDDYPQELLRQLELAVEEEVQEVQEVQRDERTGETEPQPQREGRRSRR